MGDVFLGKGCLTPAVLVTVVTSQIGCGDTSLGIRQPSWEIKDLVVSAGLAERFGLIEKPAEYRDDEARSKRRFLGINRFFL